MSFNSSSPPAKPGGQHKVSIRQIRGVSAAGFGGARCAGCGARRAAGTRRHHLQRGQPRCPAARRRGQAPPVSRCPSVSLGPSRSPPVPPGPSSTVRPAPLRRQPPVAPSRGTLGEPPVPREPSDGRGKAHPRRWEKPVLVQQPRARLRTANRALGSSPARPLFCVISSGSCVTPGVFAAARLAAVGAGRSLHPSRPQDTSRPGGAGQRGGKGWEGMGSGAEASRGVNAS